MECPGGSARRMALSVVRRLGTSTVAADTRATEPCPRAGAVAVPARSNSPHKQTASESSDSCAIDPGAGLPPPWQGEAPVPGASGSSSPATSAESEDCAQLDSQMADPTGPQASSAIRSICVLIGPRLASLRPLRHAANHSSVSRLRTMSGLVNERSFGPMGSGSSAPRGRFLRRGKGRANTLPLDVWENSVARPPFEWRTSRVEEYGRRNGEL
jgi:hypothetical protein